MSSPHTFVPGFRLRRTEENSDEIDELAERLGGRAGLDVLLADLNRKARRSAWALGRAVDRAFRWERSDTLTKRWWPQGITTSADAFGADGDQRRLAVVTWYSKKVDGINKGSRLTFVDLDTLRYRHVLLVVPVRDKDGRMSLKPLKVHAGGIVWAGPYLHIAATGKGFMTCRVDDILRIPDDHGIRDRGLLTYPGADSDEKVSTFGYRYVLPVRFSYRADTDEGLGRLRYSFMSIDRSGPSPQLVVGEYGRGTSSTRLARFAMDPESMHLVIGGDGHSGPAMLADPGIMGMQGIAVVEDTFHITTSNGPFLPGSVYVGHVAPGAAARFRRFRWATPIGCEDLSYWPSGTDGGAFWSVTEHPLRRWVFTMKRSWFAERA
ncbi:hypothetical protein BJ980_003341 [Nocardioides daedukensis]|uniref:Uncharacterized protein n=1 Tax=Nocardioides daedukensis TaxID=634462 RepID=A0A7Y9UQ89_9ACTN|nr:hypothetical protein [Nocardioides daedukensis]NYG60418.1 hypothetical protein [Nocardioides daedukensis]